MVDINISCRLKKNWQGLYTIDTNIEGCIWLVTDELIRSRAVEPQYPLPEAGRQLISDETRRQGRLIWEITFSSNKDKKVSEIDPIDQILLQSTRHNNLSNTYFTQSSTVNIFHVRNLASCDLCSTKQL